MKSNRRTKQSIGILRYGMTLEEPKVTAVNLLHTNAQTRFILMRAERRPSPAKQEFSSLYTSDFLQLN